MRQTTASLRSSGMISPGQLPPRTVPGRVDAVSRIIIGRHTPRLEARPTAPGEIREGSRRLRVRRVGWAPPTDPGLDRWAVPTRRIQARPTAPGGMNAEIGRDPATAGTLAIMKDPEKKWVRRAGPKCGPSLAPAPSLSTANSGTPPNPRTPIASRPEPWPAAVCRVGPTRPRAPLHPGDGGSSVTRRRAAASAAGRGSCRPTPAGRRGSPGWTGPPAN
jgi:hypothetical protein